MSLELRLAAPADLDASTLYRVLRLRVDVFVVEQQCPYPELDGRDLEPGTRWLWAAEGETVLATLRILREEDGSARIGRVATAQQARASGIASVLMRRALDYLDEAGAAPNAADPPPGEPNPPDHEPNPPDREPNPPDGAEVVLDAQTPLAAWYQRFGFEPAGPEFVEDGISHLPMRRPRRLSPRA